MPSFSSFEKEAIPDKIVQQILTMIQEKELLPGDRLPPERELAKMMNVGRPTLRMALKVLESMNVLKIKPGAGVFVASLDTNELLEPLNFLFALGDASSVELLEARLLVEPVLARLAAERITLEEIEVLEKIWIRSSQSVGDLQKFIELDFEFHKVIADSTRNPFLTRAMDAINQFGMAGRPKTGSSTALRKKGLQQHRMILEALQKRDGNAAHDAMQKHLEHVMNVFHDLLKTAQVSEEDKDAGG